MSLPLLPTLELEPLRVACERRGSSIAALANLAGIHSQRAYRAKGISWGDADRLACALGEHPSTIWGEDWWSVEAAKAAAVEESARRRDSRGVGWSGVERAWREWRLCRDRFELHREVWA
jgi:hypothetical protein